MLLEMMNKVEMEFDHRQKPPRQSWLRF
jgi:hypothetical protein